MPLSTDSTTARAATRGTEGRLRGWIGWWIARPTLCAALIYAVLSLIFVGQGLLPGRTLSSSDGLWTAAPWKAYRPDGVRPFGSNFELADAVAVFQPFFQFTRDALPGVPLWNPHMMAGRPFLADAQSAVFSPFTVPVYVFGLWKALAVMAALKLFVAAFGTFLFARAIGLRFGGALFAGAVYAFGTFFVVWLAWPLTNIFPLIPWILLVTELLVRRPEPLTVAALAALIGLQFLGGHPETSFHVMVVTTLWFAFRALPPWWREGHELPRLVRPVLAYGGAVILGAALAALLLVPLAEFFVHSGDYQRRLDRPASFSSSQYLGAFFLFDYWGRPTQNAIAAFVSNRGYYAGAITLMLAAVALVLRPTRTRIVLGVFAFVTMLVVLGVSPVSDVVVALPGFRTAHNGRMVIFVLLVLALLAGWGLDELTSRELPSINRRKLALGVATAIFVFPVVWLIVAGTLDLGQLKPALKAAWAFRDAPQSHAAVRLGALLEWLPLAGAGLAVVALGLRIWPALRVSAAVLAALAISIVVADLFRANMGFNPAIPLDHARQPTTGAITYLQSQTPNRFVGMGQPGEQQALGVDLAMRYGLYDARGYDFPVEKRYDKLWRAEVGPPGEIVPPTAFALPTARALRTLNLFSVSDVIQDPDVKPLRLRGLSLAYHGPDARVYRNANALPRAFLVGGQVKVGGEDAELGAVTSGMVDLRRVAVTGKPLPGLTSAAPAGTARLTEYGRQNAVAQVNATRPALMVLTDVYYPGWKAKVDGHDVPIERVDYLLRGVRVPAGAHRVELEYAPASWRAGWILSLAALVATAALALVGLRRRRA
ncbi:MAG TPA: YfhO family protein [Thermoleophilaceae bacterium]|nr:YfhO family protein [Thermoleophilaceae bacterium]